MIPHHLSNSGNKWLRYKTSSDTQMLSVLEKSNEKKVFLAKISSIYYRISFLVNEQISMTLWLGHILKELVTK